MKLKLLALRESSGESLCSPYAVAEIMREEARADRECFWVLHLDTGNQLIEKELVSVGTVNATLVHPREIFRKAVINGTVNIITVHNHPSSRMEPSPEDRKILGNYRLRRRNSRHPRPGSSDCHPTWRVFLLPRDQKATLPQ